jgi:hypothetical protein
MTQVDKLDPFLHTDPKGESLRLVYGSSKVKEAITYLASQTGINPSFIYPVKNYHSEREVNLYVDILALQVLWKAITAADTHYKNHNRMELSKNENK